VVFRRRHDCIAGLICRAAPLVISHIRDEPSPPCRPKDMDVVQIYDAFSINTILALEDLGFCAKGEGGLFVENGAIAPGGKLPVNTNGGGLSCVHPNMYGAFATIEAARQLRGECGARQVQGAKTAVVNGNGGTSASSQSTSVLATVDVL